MERFGVEDVPGGAFGDGEQVWQPPDDVEDDANNVESTALVDEAAVGGKEQYTADYVQDAADDWAKSRNDAGTTFTEGRAHL